eukprot:6479543-Amphidinium_carterae.1
MGAFGVLVYSITNIDRLWRSSMETTSPQWQCARSKRGSEKHLLNTCGVSMRARWAHQIRTIVK